MSDQLATDQDVLRDVSQCAVVDPTSSILGASDMLRLHSNKADNQTSSPNHHVQHSVGTWMSGDSSSSTDHNCHNFTPGQYSTRSVSTSISQSLAVPQPEIVYAYSTATNMLPPDLNYGSWNNAPTLHSTQYHNPVLGGASIGYSYSPAMGSGYSSTSSQIAHPNGHSLQFASGFLPYNTQWQTHAVPQPGHLSLPFTPMMSPPLSAGSSGFTCVMQPPASHGEQIGYLSDQPPNNQPHPFSLHSHSSSSLLSCRWLDDDAFTHCGFTGTLGSLKLHCKAVHFTGPKIALIECHWEGCDYHRRKEPTVRTMRRNCMWRHISEIHLGLKRGSI